MLDKKMAQNQTKFRPTICAIDEVDDPNLKMNETNKQQCDTGSETIPLTNSQLKLHLGGGVTIKKTDSKQNNCGDNGHQTATDQLTIPTSTPRSLNGIRAFSMPGRASIDAFMHWPNKIRILYITTMCLCALLLIIIILLIAFWPDVPFYLKAELCLTKQCVEASRQLLLWSNTSTNPCYNTYKWACGNFAQDYYDNDYAVIQKGEWDYKAFKEYKELNELNRFISMLPTTSLSYSVESLITSLYQSCREIDMLDKSQSDLLLRKAIKAVAAVCAAPQYGYNHHNGDKYLPPHTTKPPTVVQTNFYSYSAPEEHDHQTLSKDIYVGKPQKNYRVVFIKAPKPADASVKFNIDVAPQEEKTAIYVLSKKEGEVEASAVVNEGQKTLSKPEVYFVRYKTPEEAHAVQQEIQSEYDKLGGHKEFSDEGVAPLTSVAGALDGLGSDGSYNYQQVKGEDKHVISQYIAPVHHK